jgi:replication factor C large subunit
MSTARREIMPQLAVMTHHCTNRELTVAMAARYELEAEHVAFVTGSGKNTNKVESIVEDAQNLREEESVAASQGAFEGTPEDTEVEDEPEPAEPVVEAGDDHSEASEGEDEDDQQAGLSDFM